MPAPTEPCSTIHLPRFVSPPNTRGHTAISTAETRIAATPLIITVQRFPLKNASHSGSFVPLNRL